jgi:hypothetical protein
MAMTMSDVAALLRTGAAPMVRRMPLKVAAFTASSLVGLSCPTAAVEITGWRPGGARAWLARLSPPDWSYALWQGASRSSVANDSCGRPQVSTQSTAPIGSAASRPFDHIATFS